MGTNLIFSSGGKGDCRHVYYFHSFIQEEKETVNMCTNFIVFFRRRKRLQTFVLILLFFFRREKETVGMGTNLFFSS